MQDPSIAGGSDRASGEHEDQELLVFAFTSGIYRSLPPDQIPDGAAWDMKNVYYPRESAIPQTRPAPVLFQVGAAAPGRIVAMHVFQRDSQTSIKVFACENSMLPTAPTHLELYYLSAAREAVLIGPLESDILNPPTFCTFGNRLLIAQRGAKLKEWTGKTTDAIPVKATGSITVAGLPVADETVTIGATTFTFKAARAGAGEVTIGASQAECAVNLNGAVNLDSTEVDSTVLDLVVSLVAAEAGSAGNGIVLVDGTSGDLTLSHGHLEGGSDKFAKASGTVTITLVTDPLPSVNDYVEIAGQYFTWVTLRTVAQEVTIGATLADCATNLVAAITADSLYVDASTTGAVVNIVAKAVGTAGNLYTLIDHSGGNCYTSTATLVGGTDVVKAYGYLTIQAANGTFPLVGDTVEIGGRVYTWRAERVQPGEVAIGATEDECASNLAAAILTDSWDVTASAALHVVTVTATRTGTGGNSLPLIDHSGGHCVTSGATLAGGLDGSTIDVIDTYQAPQPSIVVSTKNGRVLAAGDTRAERIDRLYFSSTGNAWSWAYGDYGGGEYIDLGNGEGNEYSAVAVFLSEVVVHKAGQERQMYRVSITDPNPSNWQVEQKTFAANTAAINQRCAVTLADKHLALDTRTFRSFSGTDTYDEIISSQVGTKIHGFLDSPSPTTGFFVPHPDDMYLLVFPAAGKNCAVFHYGSERWTRWQFAAAYHCGAYSAAENAVLLGGADGKIYRLSAESAEDAAGAPIRTLIVGRSIGQRIDNTIVKYAALDYRHIIAGAGELGIVINRDEANVQTLMPFAVASGGTPIAEATMEIFVATEPLYVAIYARVTSADQHGEGEMIAPMVSLTSGAIAVNSVMFLVGRYGLADT